MTNDFVHLHVHSEYSMLDGLGRVKKLVAEAKRLGQPALALTDHGTMHGAVEFFRACKAAEIKPIIGVEAYQTTWDRPMGGRDPHLDKNNYHLLLLARNMAGYRNLLKIASHSQTNGFYYKPRVDHDFLARHAEGLVVSTGCLGAEVPQLIMQGKEKEAYERLGWYVDIFGRDNFFIELQEHSIPELVDVNKVLAPWAKKFDLRLLATNDVHYVREEDGSPHDVLLCVQTGSTVGEEKRMRMSDSSYFLKSRAQMEETFRPLIDLPSEAFDNTLLIAEMCEVDLEDPEYHLPDLPIPINETYETQLRKLTEAGLTRLYGERAKDPDVQERKERELRIIHEMGFDVYFLIVADMCDFARERNIWWNVRGSGAGSLVAYCTGITGIDPLKNNLIFERFLNPGRVTMPDFDLDYPDDQREEMIRYTIDKYGENQVAQIVTFGRMKARAAIRDVGRAKAIALPDVDRIAKMIPGIPGKPVTIQNVLTEDNEFYNPELRDLYRKEAWVRDLLDTSMQLEGVARHAGIHAAAVIVADRDLEHYTPLMRGSKSSITSTIAQYEFPILESIGLLKVDFLGLSTLSVMREAGRLIRERHGITYDLSNIPFEGEAAKEAFTLLSSGEVSGVFQVESQGMRRVLTEMHPSAFEHIIATISLYRPGPIEYIPQFIRRMHGEEEVEFKHPALEPILAETYGIIVYQEQIIQILSKLAGYTPGDADLVRRAISKKKQAEIDRHRQLFIEGCEKNGIPKKAADAIYGDIDFFARYGFNKCLPGDVEVLDATSGRLVRVRDLFTGAVRIDETVTCDIDELRLRPGRISAVMENGVKPVYKLTTALGRTIEATDNHPFYTFDGWRLLGELSVGDQIAVPRTLPVEGSVKWPDQSLIHFVQQLAAGEFNEIPSDIFSLTLRQTSLLAETYWQIHGQSFVSGQGVTIPTHRIGQQLQHLLLRLGILSRLSSNGSEFYLSIVDGTATNHRMNSVADMPKPVETSSTAMLSAFQRTSSIRHRIHSVDVLHDDRIQKDHIYWDKVVNIEYVGDKQTYDLEVPGTHNFIANDILVHNSHAADYAVITVQTAYLKAHYPVDYMAALLLIERDKTDKVVNFINECRRMGIDVLPPDINYSGLDFDIQERPADTPSMAERDPHLAYNFPVPKDSAIRFGMAAIKNVGEGPVNVILAERAKGGPFASLEELCDRVDLRQVNKRALESLIKAGALDRFGKRSQLLAVLEQMLANSASIHSARASGQLSMFDMLGESSSLQAPAIVLPDIDEVKGRERLQWEKELLGVYSMSHPLQHLSIDVEKIVTCACNELNERYDGKQVTMIGMITDVRAITTKKGDPMAFMHIEDLKGQCEVVVFPRTYEQFRDKLVLDSVVLIKGQAQTRNGQTNLLADNIQSYVEQAVERGAETSQHQEQLFDAGATVNGVSGGEGRDFDVSSAERARGEEAANDVTMSAESADNNDAKSSNGARVAANHALNGAENGVHGSLPAQNGGNGMNRNFDQHMEGADAQPTGEANPFRGTPPDWAMEEESKEEVKAQPDTAVDTTVGAARDEKPVEPAPEPAVASSLESQPQGEAKRDPGIVRETSAAYADQSNAGQSNDVTEEQPPAKDNAGTPVISDNERSAARTQKQSPPQTQRRQPQHLTISFRRSGDIDRDIFRLKELYERVRDPRGRDHFHIRLESKGRPVTLDFPNDACTVSERLTGELARHFRVEFTINEG